MLTFALLVMIATTTHGQEKRHVVTVSAQSEFRIAPDEAIISFSVSTLDKKLLSAKAENDGHTSAIVTAVKAQSVVADDFKVTDLKIGPSYDERSRAFLGYSVRRSFEVRTKDFSIIDGLIGGIVEAAGDSVSIRQLHFQVRDQRRHQVEARRLAVEYAREKASHLAELNHMKLGNAISISEDVEYNLDAGGFGGFGGGGFSGVQPPADSLVAVPELPVPNTQARVRFASQQKEAVAANVAEKEPAANRDVLLSAGQVSLNATVKIEFELLPKP
jgi:uncharacterized protein YggE